MSTEPTKDSVPPESSASSEPETNQEKKDTVAYDTYRRTVGEAKNAKEKLRSIEAELEKYRQKELETQGNYAEVLKAKDQKIQESEEKIKKSQQAIRNYILGDSIKKVALKSGANPQALEDLLKVGDWSDVALGEDLAPDEAAINEKISKLSQEKPFYFSKQAGPVKEVILNGVKSGATKSVDQMSIEELKNYYKSL